MSDDLLAAELEALSFTYTEEELKVVCEKPLEIFASVSPQATDTCSEEYVHATLRLETGAAYPDEPAWVTLLETKGLGEKGKNALKEELQEEAASMVGELMLGHLYEAAKALLTEMNHPEGDCAICLEPLRRPGGYETAQSVQKLTCYHCLHRSCFASWFTSEQASKREKLAQLHEKMRHAVNDRLLGELGLRTEQNGLFTVLCPHCRASFDPNPFSKADAEKLADEASAYKLNAKESFAALPEELKQDLRRIQQQQHEIFERQMQKGGIVPDSYAVALR